MQKLLLFVAVLCGIFYLRRWLAKDQESHRHHRGVVGPGEEAEPQSMRECVVCGVLVPEAEAVCIDKTYYCSLAHAEAHRGGKPR